MLNLNDNLLVKSSGKIICVPGKNNRIPYKHQKEAMGCLNIIDREKSYSTLVVLPTGGGKTYTASLWLLKNAIDKSKKILWIAHRRMLLDQAAESFKNYAYKENLPNTESFSFRVISGSENHDIANAIKKDDNLIIASKDSIGRNLKSLDKWLNGEDEVYLVIDEAHHATAKTYRKIIDYISLKVNNLKMMGLTATPFRTADNEKGLLSKIFCDGVENGIVLLGNKGITYQVGLKELISKGILARPEFESYYTYDITKEEYGKNIGLKALENINRLDSLPEDIRKSMAENALRNKFIVNTYKKKELEYGQTILFAISIEQAIHLSELFNKNGIKADYIVSSIKDSFTGATKTENNDKKIEEYRKGNIKVLINVNILTEGSDLPETKTIFLTRPTISTTLMTQMVGRALRGESAGGTNKAYIVSFIDNWSEHIAWINPESLFEGDNYFEETKYNKQSRILRNIAISKIQEFADILDDTIDTTAIESISFDKRIPLGMYSFMYIDENGMDHFCNVMVYDSTKRAYDEFIDSLPELFNIYNLQDEEYIPNNVLKSMERKCKDTFFIGEMIPSYDKNDILDIIKYYSQKEIKPKFYTFEDIDRNKLDIKLIAENIINKNMNMKEERDYIENIWEDKDENLIKIFFGNKISFLRSLENEKMKINYPDIYENIPEVKYDMKRLEDLSLNKIREISPNTEKKLRDDVFEKSKSKNGEYTCQICGKTGSKKIGFQVDHIKPINKGGKSTLENLQILCNKCNGIKGDKYV